MKRQFIALSAVTALMVSMAAVSPRIPSGDAEPVAPVIPDVPRNDDSKVFLEHADKLSATPSTDYQVLTGDVAFRRNGMFMWCDSAHFYDATGSFDAFGNVRMEQGDTLFIYADTLHYNEPARLATLVADYGSVVRLINRDVTLTTDIFNYDLGIDLGYYETGGTLTDRQNRLTSLEGEYSPTTKEAIFRENVKLTSLSKNDTLRILSENLYYNTMSHVALLVAPSTVINSDGTIVTSNGAYNTETTQAELYDRSTVTYRNGNTLTGDTLFYNRQTGLGEAFGNVEINDTTNHMMLLGSYGYAFEPLDSAYVTGRAMAIEYSSADSLFLHGDTIRIHRVISRRMEKLPLPADSTALNDSLSIQAASTVLSGYLSVPAPADSITLPDSIAAGESEDIIETVAVTGRPSGSIIEAAVQLLTENLPAQSGSTVAESIAGNLASPSDSLAAEPTMLMEGVTEMMVERIDTVRYLVAAPRVKFYRRDLQGLCDSMTVVSTDSMLYMDRFPIVWSETRQITGQQIKVHFNDSTADNATVTNNAFMAQKIEDGYFNQLAGKEMYAILANGSLSHLDVNGNVQAIFFPEESDSTINKIMSLESSFLSADFAADTITRMKIWPETSAIFTPLYLARKSQMFLQQFRWLETFRPLSRDDIFDFSDELVEALNNAPTLKPETKPWNQQPAPPSGPTPAPSSDSLTHLPAISSQSTASPESSTPVDSDTSTQADPGILNREDDTIQ